MQHLNFKPVWWEFHSLEGLDGPAIRSLKRPDIPWPASWLSQWDAPSGSDGHRGSDDAKTQAPSESTTVVAEKWTGQWPWP